MTQSTTNELDRIQFSPEFLNLGGTPRQRFLPLPQNAFPAASLIAWMSIVQRAGVKAVPAEVVGSIRTDSLLRFDSPEEDDVHQLAQLKEINDCRPDGHMLRWDCCASEGMKFAAGEGVSSCPSSSFAIDLFPGDCRSFDIIYEFPSNEVAVLQRPWVTPMMFNSHPVEYRVFVCAGEVVAVSNYYIQRDLPATPEFLSYAAVAANLAKLIIAKAKDDGRYPWVTTPRNIPEAVQQSIWASLDFLVTPQGEVLFLEAGPGVKMGAHPCCFLDDETFQILPLEGVRLGKAGETHPF